MKIDPHLPQLPSIAELLEHPRVKGAVARINRSTIAQRAAGFVDELRSSLAKRTGITDVPSVTQLAERLARRLLGEPVSDGPIINATGVVVGDMELTPPLADAAAHAMMLVASEYHAGKASLHQLQIVEKLLCRLAGAEAALVTSSVEAAATLALAATAGNREAVVIETPQTGASGVDWQWLAARAGVVLRHSSGEGLSDAAQSSGHVGAFVWAAAATAETDLARLRDHAKRVSLPPACCVDVAPLSGLVDPNMHGFQSVTGWKPRLAAGADILVADGAGLLGGPSCGIVLGGRSHVEHAAQHPLASLLTPQPAILAALLSTLSMYENDAPDAVSFSIPVWQLLSAPRDNLKQRAERLAALIAACPGVGAAAATPVDSAWLRSGAESAAAPSWVVAVRLHSIDAQGLLSRLRAASHPIVARQADDEVHLDLRSVFPRADQSLVAAFEGLVVD